METFQGLLALFIDAMIALIELGDGDDQKDH